VAVTPQQKRRRAVLQRVIEASISLGFLALALRSVDLQEVAEQLKTANWFWLIPAVLITVALLFLKAWRWQLLFLPDSKPNFWAVFTAMSAGYLASNVLPARAGEVVRLVLLASEEDVTAARTLSTIVVERILDVLSLLVVLALLLPFVELPAAIAQAARGLAVIAIVATVIMILLSYRKDQVMALAHRILGKVRFLDRQGVYDSVEHLLDGFVTLRGRLGVFMFALSLLGWVGVIGMAWTSARAVNLDLSIQAATFTVVMTSLAMLIPSAPGYIGVFESVTTQALQPFGIPASIAFGYALVYHAMNYLTLCAAGVLSMWIHGTSMADVFGRLRKGERLADA
jgi:uncharacterized protein (TIRG00374 family)